MLEKEPAHSIISGSTQFLLSYFIFTRVRLDQNMEYYICSGAVQSLLLLLLYQHGKCSDEIYSFAPPVQTFTAKSQHATSTELKHVHFLSVPKVNSAQTAFPQDLWNSLLCECFHNYYNLNLFNSLVTMHLLLTNFTFIFAFLTIIFYFEWLSSFI